MTSKQLTSLNQSVIKVVAAILQSSVVGKTYLGYLPKVDFQIDDAAARIHTEVGHFSQNEITTVQNIVASQEGLIFWIQIEDKHIDIIVKAAPEE